MNEIIKYVLEGNLFIAYLLIVIPFGLKYIVKRFKDNPRLKFLPYWFAGIVLIVIALNSFNLISIQYTWILILIVLIFFIYLSIVKTSNKATYEYFLSKKLLKDINNNEVECFETFYKKYKKYFRTTTGKFYFYMTYLNSISDIFTNPLQFDILEDIEKLNLTKKEKIKFYLLEFNIFNSTGAIRNWEDKYVIDNLGFDEKDLLLVKSILAFQKFDLNNAEIGFKKLLAKSNSSNYKAISESNLGIIEEYRGNNIGWNDYCQKAYNTIQTNKTYNSTVVYNLINNYLFNQKIDEATTLFKEYINKYSNRILDQRILIENKKLTFYRQLSNNEEIKSSIFKLFNEYKRAPESKKYPLLISLFRISYNNILFEEILKEIEDRLDNILVKDFSVIMILCKETLGVAKVIKEIYYKDRVFYIAEKGFEKIKEFNFDLEISKLKHEEVNLKREYIKFKMELLSCDLIINNVKEHKKFLTTRFKILDELISLDKKNLYAFNQLDSLFIKLDEITNGINYFKHYYKLPVNCVDIQDLISEANKLIPIIELIISNAPKAKAISAYYLQLAHHHCILNNPEKGYNYFQKFKESEVSLDHYANWLKEWYICLEKFFNSDCKGL